MLRIRSPEIRLSIIAETHLVPYLTAARRIVRP
jgi:hypothetical protein